MQQLSKNFYLSEFTASQYATRHGLSNQPNEQQIKSLTALAQNILQPVRDHYRAPVIISSGYRSPLLNIKVGGSKTSQHCSGEAADFEIPGVSNKEVANWISRNLNYDQLILEFYDGKNLNSGWVHCSYRSQFRKQYLSFNGRKYQSWA